MATVPSPEVKLNYLQLGRGDDLVLIHGLGANLSFWYFGAAPLLAARHNLLMYDLRGHGRSSMPPEGYGIVGMARDLADLLDKLLIKRADIVGHSYGGGVALMFAALYPNRVRSLIVADTQIRALQPPMRLSEWAYWQSWKEELKSNGLEHPPSDDSLIDFELLARLSHYRGKNANDERPRRVSMRARDLGDRGLARWQQLLRETSAAREFEEDAHLVPPTLAKIGAPTLLAFGKYSHCLPTADRLLDCLPNARLIIIPGAGHFYPIVRPAFFARVTERFLAGQQTSSSTAVLSRTLERRRRRFGNKRLSV
jgi:pimeloyl-ACP methyl ester carboxylesterase